MVGDFNCARDPIDIHNAHGNVSSAGFTPQERESFQKACFGAVHYLDYSDCFLGELTEDNASVNFLDCVSGQYSVLVLP